MKVRVIDYVSGSEICESVFSAIPARGDILHINTEDNVNEYVVVWTSWNIGVDGEPWVNIFADWVDTGG